MPLRIAVVTPFAFPSVRGNAVTVERIAGGLRQAGADLRVWDLSITPEAVIEREVEAFGPRIIHAFHAYRVGPFALRLARRHEVPLVVTVTGTDANHDLSDPQRAATVRGVLEGAATVVVFHDSLGARITGALPEVAARLVTIPQAAVFSGPHPFDLAARWSLPAERVLFVFPAGIRMVKQPLLPLAPFDRLVQRRPQVRLLYVGPVLDPDQGEYLLGELASRPWARHVGAVPHGQMRSLLAQSDVVLNCSISEGGMSNSVLEALAAGRPVLASDIDGNRSLVEDGVTGFLFRDTTELEAKAEQLAADRALRERLGLAGRDLVERRYPPRREVESYLGVYARLAPVASA
ncbi:MAG: hypothetical protein AUG14_03235 [Candidatus Rokubacteria bacterium 13_1_20CM_2_68_19]|nr:MAG: hypothetical protein AUH76_02685 [Candidatus Rokubacteria bacterium 13_1_40CM_4_67_11]OLE44803.1 MAG: hypothetical protein AUG14_03235 [Candidatus Rokubacteria bacterium 13_1_20CM_2_68_19]